ncbi:hypothetical protein D3C73_1117260 [compost metagenome]
MLIDSLQMFSRVGSSILDKVTGPGGEEAPVGAISLQHFRIRDRPVFRQSDYLFAVHQGYQLLILCDAGVIVTCRIVNIGTGDIYHIISRIPFRILGVPYPNQVV